MLHIVNILFKKKTIYFLTLYFIFVLSSFRIIIFTICPRQIRIHRFLKEYYFYFFFLKKLIKIGNNKRYISQIYYRTTQ